MLNNEVKISYRKEHDREGLVYNTCVKMNKDMFSGFLNYISEIYNTEIKQPKEKRMWTDILIGYIKDDLDEYKQDSNIMYLRLTTTALLGSYLYENNLNKKNRNLIGNTLIKINN